MGVGCGATVKGGDRVVVRSPKQRRLLAGAHAGTSAASGWDPTIPCQTLDGGGGRWRRRWPAPERPLPLAGWGGAHRHGFRIGAESRSDAATAAGHGGDGGTSKGSFSSEGGEAGVPEQADGNPWSGSRGWSLGNAGLPTQSAPQRPGWHRRAPRPSPGGRGQKT